MQITVKAEPLGISETLDMDGSMTLADFKMLCCMQLVGDDQLSAWNLYRSRDNSLLPSEGPAATTEIHNHFKNGDSLILSKTAPKSSSQSPTRSPARKQKRGMNSDVLTDAMESFLNRENSSSSAPKPSLNFDFSGIKVKASSSSSTPTSSGTKVELTSQEIMQHTYLFNTLKADSMMKAQMEQRMPVAVRKVESDDLKGFLEYFREIKSHQMEERKKMFSVLSNPDSKQAQEYMAKVKMQEAVADNFKMAMEYSPEAFGSVFMLYINCKVNNCEIKAFIDSGAQMSIMSATMAAKCSLDKILDERFAGTAVGVGTQKILGKVHYCQLEIDNKFFHNSFSILEGQKMEVILGLDFLKRHRASVDLGRNALVLPDAGIAARFLNESELPQSANMNLDEMDTSASSTSAAQSDPKFKENVQKLSSMGFPSEQCEAMLRTANGDFDTALAMLMPN